MKLAFEKLEVQCYCTVKIAWS